MYCVTKYYGSMAGICYSSAEGGLEVRDLYVTKVALQNKRIKSLLNHEEIVCNNLVMAKYDF